MSSSIENRSIFITGGAGFIGSTLLGSLLEKNRITVYDSLERNALAKTGLESHPNLTLIQGDILEPQKVADSIPDDVDMVVHMAAVAGIDTVIKKPVRTMEVNLIGTYNVLNALRIRNKIEQLERLVDFSTSEVFGVSAFRVEETSPTNIQPVGEARWTYAVSKLAAEHLAHSYHKQYGMRTVTVRPFNVYGPGQVGEGAIHHFVQKAIRNEPLTIHGDGDQIRSWCYIDDMVDGIFRCLTSDKAVGNVFNIGNPRGTITILGLAEKIIFLADSRSVITHQAKNYVDVELRIPRIDKAQERLQFHPRFDLNEGISRTIDWYRRQLAAE